MRNSSCKGQNYHAPKDQASPQVAARFKLTEFFIHGRLQPGGGGHESSSSNRFNGLQTAGR
jgi:hypothetical protein